MPKLVELTSQVITAYLRRNSVAMEEIDDIIRDVAEALRLLRCEPVKQQPAVPIEQSVCRNHLVCLEDGEKVTLLKRHLRNNYNLTPEQYRQKWGLPYNYPMVPAGYSKARARNAIVHGLGKT
ncbi:MAG: MucR family transcriptional regulator [Porticoccaceae bacterium]